MSCNFTLPSNYETVLELSKTEPRDYRVREWLRHYYEVMMSYADNAIERADGRYYTNSSISAEAKARLFDQAVADCEAGYERYKALGGQHIMDINALKAMRP